MNKFFAFLILPLFTLVSCDVDGEWSDPDNPYEEYTGRMIERIRIEHSPHNNDYIYYEYDRRGRIISIEDTYQGATDYFTYTEDDYDDIVVVRNSLGEDRCIYLDWDGHAEKEESYKNGNIKQFFDYSYVGDKLYSINIEDYNVNGDIITEEEYDIDYDSNNNLVEIKRHYEENDYYEDIELSFSGFSEYKNNYNVDILSIIGLYLEGDYASLIGRTGERNGNLPTRATLSVKRNSRNDEDIIYRISYIADEGYITTIIVSPSNGIKKTYYLNYK